MSTTNWSIHSRSTWDTYRQMIKVKHPHIQSTYPLNGIEGETATPTHNTIKLTKQPGQRKNISRHKARGHLGGAARTHTITVYI